MNGKGERQTKKLYLLSTNFYHLNYPDRETGGHFNSQRTFKQKHLIYFVDSIIYFPNLAGRVND